MASPRLRHGKSGRFSVRRECPDVAKSRVKFTQATLGNMVIEFIQPVAGPGRHRDHFDRFGQGLQHIAFTVKDPQTAMAHLLGLGGKQTMSNYVGPERSNGVHG